MLGCADIPSPANSWTRRHDNEMTIFCRDDDTRYHVVCRDGRWAGHIGSCSNTNPQQGFTIFIRYVVIASSIFCVTVFSAVD